MRCEHRASPNYSYQCVLEVNHKEIHAYEMNGKRFDVNTCCPDGQIKAMEDGLKKSKN